MNNRKIELPNYTQTPNVLFDGLFKEMGEAELRVTLAICRQTFGYHKNRDKISLSQLMYFTGLSRQGVLNGIDAGVERGVLKRTPSGNTYFYELNMVNEVDHDEIDSQRNRLEIVNEVDHTSQRSRPKSVYEVDTQKKKEIFKEKKESESTQDIFDSVQDTISSITGMLPDNGAVKAINEIIDMKATEEDIKSAYQWIIGEGKRFIYYNQLVGPTRTAMAMRIQKENNGIKPTAEPQYREIYG